MDEQNRNLLLATALSALVIIGWTLMFPPEPPAPRLESDIATASDGLTPPAVAEPQIALSQEEVRATAVASAPRISIETPRLTGSLSLIGGRIDDLRLKDYRETQEDDADIVTLLSPVGAPQPYYALYGWAPAGSLGFDAVPTVNTQWTVASGEMLTPSTPLTLEWNNGAGLVFERVVSIDEDYMFQIEQRVRNTGTDAVRLAPYGLIARHGQPDTVNFFVLHEGVVSKSDGQLGELTYDDMTDLEFNRRENGHSKNTPVESNGWIGFTDKYWMTTLIPQDGQEFQSVAKYVPTANVYQTETRLPTMTVAAGETAEVSTQLFAGAKEWDAIVHYQNDPSFWAKLGGQEQDPDRPVIDRFVDSIDWGWFYFLTKPIFIALHWLNLAIGNMGWAIIGLTVIIKALLLPLAYKSYVSMAKMKELQPEMEEIKERAGEDREKLQREMMDLYKKKKVNPAAGCLPILLQIPIFFSLYKVIFVTIELRHAPFFGPFQDLSAPDPTSIINLFGWLPNAAPEPGSILAYVFIGILPILLGISMWFQQKLNPAPTDPTQQAIFAWMPWIFMFMLGGFASGLVVYWIANNTITFTQQYLIMRSQGYKPDLMGNILSSFKKKES